MKTTSRLGPRGSLRMLTISPTVASMDVSSLISRRSASAGSSPVETQPEKTPHGWRCRTVCRRRRTRRSGPNRIPETPMEMRVELAQRFIAVASPSKGRRIQWMRGCSGRLSIMCPGAVYGEDGSDLHVTVDLAHWLSGVARMLGRRDADFDAGGVVPDGVTVRSDASGRTVWVIPAGAACEVPGLIADWAGPYWVPDRCGEITGLVCTVLRDLRCLPTETRMTRRLVAGDGTAVMVRATLWASPAYRAAIAGQSDEVWK